MVFNKNMILVKFKVIIFFLQLSLSSLLANEIEVNYLAGVKNYHVSTKGTVNTSTYLSNMIAKIRANLDIMNKYFITASGYSSILKENDEEHYDISFNNSLKYSTQIDEFSLEVIGGMEVIPLFNPFVGFSFAELKFAHQTKNDNPDLLFGDQTISDYDFIVGLHGKYEWSDYISFGYCLKYKISSPLSSVDYRDEKFTSIDASNYSSELFLKYWLPNEIVEIGFHLFGGKYLSDKDVKENQLLPDTDIKFVGAFVSFKINL